MNDMISIAQLSSEPWGTLNGGDRVRLYTLRNAHGMKVAISDLGATLVSWHAPDRTGRLEDILLGHDTPADYVAATTYMYCNDVKPQRIATSALDASRLASNAFATSSL